MSLCTGLENISLINLTWTETRK